LKQFDIFGVRPERLGLSGFLRGKPLINNPNADPARIVCMGRPRIDISVPTGDFTTKTLEGMYPRLSTTVLRKRLKEWLDCGGVRLVGKRQQETAQQKAWYLYKAVSGSD
jgi:hypothetical protein